MRKGFFAEVGIGKVGGDSAMGLREVMDIRQASQYLGISPDTLYRYLSQGKLPAFKLGNRWRIKKSTLDRWMERQSQWPETRSRQKAASAGRG